MPEFDIVFEVTVRTSDRRGDDFLVPDVEVETWWTNLFESPETIIDLYHDHGTSEQFHSELKTDMDVERLPSCSMKVNGLVLALFLLAFNTVLVWTEYEAVTLWAYANKLIPFVDWRTSPSTLCS